MDRQQRISILEKWFEKTNDLDSSINEYLSAIGVDSTRLTEKVFQYIDMNIGLLAKVTGIDEDWLLAYDEIIETDVCVYGQEFKITDIPSFLDAVEADERGAKAELEDKP